MVGGKEEESKDHVQWLVRGTDTGTTCDPRLFFLVWECKDVNISDLSKMLDIERRERKNLEAWGSGKGKEKAIAGPRAGGTRGLVEADVHPRARRGWTSITYGDLGICCTITKEAAGVNKKPL